MSSVVISGDTSGAITLSAPAVAGTNTITLPASTGTVMVNGPAFSASTTTNQAISASTYTKVTFGTEQFDTNNNFASSTFTPTVAGYYQLNISVNFGGNLTCLYGNIFLYKNGAPFRSLTSITATSILSIAGSCLVYANGSSDYFEIYAYTGQSSVSIYGDASNSYTWFNGSLVRSA